MKFVIFHGAFGSPERAWFPYLKNALESLGQEAIVPEFPVDNWDEITKNGPKTKPINQNLSSWLKVFKNILPPLINRKLCFVGHSLGPLFILHLVDKFNLQLDSAIFVAPFLRKLNRLWQIDLVNKSFYKSNFNFKKLRRLIPVSYLLYSENDPYVDQKYSLEFGKELKSSTILVKGAQHMNTDTGFTKFPLILELCKTRLDYSL